MGLLRKMGILVGALVHKPFTPRPPKADPDEEPAGARDGRDEPGSPPRPSRAKNVSAGDDEPGVVDNERVADLIARRQDRSAG